VSRRIDEMLGMENMMILDRYWIRDHGYWMLLYLLMGRQLGGLYGQAVSDIQGLGASSMMTDALYI
jgi:hypothetical protein